MKRYPARRLTWGLLLAVLLSACNEHWGDDLERFAQNRARPLSVDYATAFLRDRWAATHQTQALGFLAKSRLLSNHLAAIEPPAQNDSIPDAELPKNLISVETYLADLLVLHHEIELTQIALRLWQESCQSRDLFDQTDLSKIAFPPPVYSPIKGQYTGYIDFVSVWKTLEKFLEDLPVNFTGRSVDQQNAKAIHAIDIFIKERIQGNELFELSRKICTEESVLLAAAQQDIQGTLDELMLTLRQTRATMQLARNGLLARMAPLELEAFLRSDGTLDFLLKQQQAREAANLRVDLQRMRSSVIRATQGLSRATTTDDRIRKKEELENLLVAYITQLEFLLKYATPKADLKMEVEAFRKDYEEKFQCLTVSGERGCSL